MAKHLTPEQKFRRLFDLSNDESTTAHEREVAQRKWQKWLSEHGKKPIDISAILAQAERDDAAANPPPPPDPPHPFDDPAYNPATLVEDVACKYVVMRPPARIIYVLWIVATHVYVQFRIAPRVLLASEEPDSGKTTALELARSLIFRANEETFATDAALRDDLDQGAGSIALDEGDLYEPASLRALLRLWNIGHVQGASHTMMVGGQRKTVNVFAPMIAAGLSRTQFRRTEFDKAVDEITESLMDHFYRRCEEEVEALLNEKHLAEGRTDHLSLIRRLPAISYRRVPESAERCCCSTA
jgi:hypothetical protein